MSILRTHNLQNPDSSSINIVMDQGGNTNITGVTTVGSNFHVTDGISRIGALTEYGTKTVSDKGLIISSSGENTLKLIDTTSYTSNVGASILLGGQYRASGDAQEFVKLKSFKENSTNGDYAYGFSVSTNANGGVVTERFRITSSGDVGIGTDNPSAKLDIRGQSNTNFEALTLRNTHSNGSSQGQVDLNFDVVATTGDVARSRIRGQESTSDSPNSELTFWTSDTTATEPTKRVTINKTGNLGIGTDIPTSDLHVFRSTSTSSIIDAAAGDALLTLRNAGNTNWSGINFTRERSTGTNVTGGSIWMPSDTANNSATLYLQTQSASANAGVSGALTDNNGVRLKLASQPGGHGPDSAFTVEVGSTEKFRVSAGGIVTTPNQPAFNVRGFPAHRYMNVWHNVDLDDWNYVNQNGSHFDNSTGRFTAPVEGKYFFIFTSMYTNPSTGDFHNIILKNGSNFVISNNHSGGGSGNGHQWNDCTIQAVIPLAANDYVTARCTGSSQNNLYLYGNSASSTYSCFCGFLVG